MEKSYDLSKIDWKFVEGILQSGGPKFNETMNQHLRDWFRGLAEKSQIPGFKRLANCSPEALLTLLHLGFSEEHFIRTLLGDVNMYRFDADNPNRGKITEGQHRVGS